MPNRPGASERRRPWPAARAALAVGAALAALALLASPAHAHDQLVASSPTDGEHLDTAPAEVRLSFNGEPLEVGTTVMVTDLDGGDH
ncbi:copper resistance CopC family protein, partial [Pseudactinotalea sp.]|uniref:copper resistance CopC family protein n=1 Tax=Pseudactinotalea sp. TaxID=1926260 RepID=UPI003B3ABB03